MRNFYSVPFGAYKGQLSSRAINARGQLGACLQAKVPWGAYSVGLQALGTANPQFNVQIEANAAGPNTISQLWQIRSVYIDNTGCNFPVYVYFPDTDYAVPCPANNAGWFRAFTIARRAWIVGLGISNLDISNGATTSVYFTDLELNSYIDPEIAVAVQLGIATQNINIGAGSGGNIIGINPVVPGSGYVANTMGITGGGGSGATALGVLDQFGRFTQVNVQTPGTLYSGPPNITAVGGQGLIAPWISNVFYNQGQIVSNAGQYYTARTGTIGAQPSSNPAQWSASGVGVDQPAVFSATVSPLIGGSSVTNSSIYGARALGDQILQSIDAITAAGVFKNNMFGTPYTSGFIYLTNISVNQLVSQAGVTAWQLEDQNNNTIMQFENNTLANSSCAITSIQGANIKLPATSTYRLRCTSFTGNVFASHGFAYTYAAF